MWNTLDPSGETSDKRKNHPHADGLFDYILYVVAFLISLEELWAYGMDAIILWWIQSIYRKDIKLAKVNYQYEKRQKELEKKRKKEQKEKLKQIKKNVQPPKETDETPQVPPPEK